MKNFEDFNEKINLSDVNDSNVLKIIKGLLKKGDIDTIARIMTDYSTKVNAEKHKEISKICDDSIYKEQIDSLIRGMLGIFG